LANPAGSLAGSLALPFIQYNTARLTEQSAKVSYDMATINFQKTLYTTLQDTENALSARQRLVEQTQYLREALTQVRWQQGSTDIQPWLDAQRARRQAELSLLQNTLARKNNAVQLYAALGGGGDYQGTARTAIGRAAAFDLWLHDPRLIHFSCVPAARHDQSMKRLMEQPVSSGENSPLKQKFRRPQIARFHCSQKTD
jgi:hypothetical protein